MTNDAVADLLIRIKNSYMVRKKVIEVDYFGLGGEILRILKSNKFIKDFRVKEVPFARKKDKTRKVFEIELLYLKRKAVLDGVERVSKCGVRMYEGKDDLKKYLSKVGIYIVSTSKGVMSLGEAIKAGSGGEVICRVW